ncbi:hypothetical protein [Haloglycomyces albus]|uniref:hypothetical protein n=1 Tax=Haloglycomyces albus TaxID=526067 RepID=UPI00046D0235|nr:hypothetical protein [Haloglycomyces albus]
MTDQLHYRKTVEAVATKDVNKFKQLLESLPEDQAQKYMTYLAALFAAFLEEYFKDGISRDAIAGLVNKLRYEYREATEPKFNALTAEGVIRGSAGEPHLMDDIPTNDVVHVQMMVIAALATEGTTTRPDLYRFLNEADAIMAEWDTPEE